MTATTPRYHESPPVILDSGDLEGASFVPLRAPLGRHREPGSSTARNAFEVDAEQLG
jgi:hypothetical protein